MKTYIIYDSEKNSVSGPVSDELKTLVLQELGINNTEFNTVVAGILAGTVTTLDPKNRTHKEIMSRDYKEFVVSSTGRVVLLIDPEEEAEEES